VKQVNKVEIDKDYFGTIYYILDGKLHREDGPAMVFADGSKLWYRNGELHREDGPAIEYASGNRQWFVNGICVKVCIP